MKPTNIKEPSITKPLLSKGGSATKSSSSIRMSHENLLSTPSSSKTSNADLSNAIGTPSAPVSPYSVLPAFESPTKPKVIIQSSPCPYPLLNNELKAEMKTLIRRFHETNIKNDDTPTSSPIRVYTPNYQQVLHKIALSTVVTAPYGPNKRPCDPSELVVNEFETKLNEDYQMTFQKSKISRTDLLEYPKNVIPIKFTMRKRSNSVPQAVFPQEEIKKVIQRNNDRFRAFALWYVNAPKPYTPIFDLKEQMKIETEAIREEEDNAHNLLKEANAKKEQVLATKEKNENEKFSVGIEINKIKTSTLELEEELAEINREIADSNQSIEYYEYMQSVKHEDPIAKFEKIEYNELQEKLQSLQKEVDENVALHNAQINKINELYPVIENLNSTLDKWGVNELKLLNERLYLMRRMKAAEKRKKVAQTKLSKLNYQNSLKSSNDNQDHIQKLTQEVQAKQQVINTQAGKLAAK